MKKILVVLFSLLIAISVYPAQDSDPGKKSDKIVLPALIVQNSEIALVVNNINNYILRKKDGWLWPVSKIIFSKKADDIIVDIVGIDNSWANLFHPHEQSIGYFILNNRMFVVSVKNYDAKNIEGYFMSADESKTFSQPDPNLKATDKPCPIWHYKFTDGTMIVTGYEGI